MLRPAVVESTAGLAINAGWRFETERLTGIADYCAD
jgi:hypothetical protein